MSVKWQVASDEQSGAEAPHSRRFARLNEVR